MVDERGTEERDAQEVGDLGCVGELELRLKKGLLHSRRTAPPPGLGPAHAQVAGAVELALPTAPHLHERVGVVAGIAHLLGPRTL